MKLDFSTAPQPFRRSLLATLWLTASITICGAASERAPSVIAPSVEVAGVVRTAIGVTRDGTRVDAFLQADDFDFRTAKTRLLIIGGLAGDRSSVDAALETLQWFHDPHATHDLRRQFTLSAIPCANPAALKNSRDVGLKLDLTLGYPPPGSAYHNDPHPDEAAYLWRWLGMHAPDLVIDLRVASAVDWHVPETTVIPGVTELPPLKSIGTQGDLVVELGRHDVCQTGAIPAIRVETPAADVVQTMQVLLQKLQAAEPRLMSPARKVLRRRMDRSAPTVAAQLTAHYGHDLNQVVYIPAIALIGRLRWGALSDDPAHRAAVQRIVKPYVDGDRPSTPTSGSGLSGHLIFTELAAASEPDQRERYLALARTAADMAFDESGKIKPMMPFHNEMSDAAFMGGPILASVGRLTRDDRYYQACAIHLQSVRELLLREDGLYRHSPLDEAAWGRGNGFPALGLAMCLAEFPSDHPARPELLEQFQRHLRALARHQDATGCWHQVIDRPESYRELSSTCMITYALARGIRGGWLPRPEFQPVVDRAWQAILARVSEDGRLVDVCTGTGKQRTLRDYYDRTAILGRDPRGGAMALLATVELAEMDDR